MFGGAGVMSESRSGHARRLCLYLIGACPDAGDAWAARSYSNYIGSPELLSLTKRPFLEMFRRNDVAAEDLRG
jgi:hypothetical protein